MASAALAEDELETAGVEGVAELLGELAAAAVTAGLWVLVLGLAVAPEDVGCAVVDWGVARWAGELARLTVLAWVLAVVTRRWWGVIAA